MTDHRMSVSLLNIVEPLDFRKELVVKPNIEYIKKEMERRKWTGSQLAMKMGVSRMEVSRFLRGKRVGGKKCIGGLIKAFPNADFNNLFFGLSGTHSFRRKENLWNK